MRFTVSRGYAKRGDEVTRPASSHPSPGADVAERSWADALDDAVAHVGPGKTAFHFDGPGWHVELSYGRWQYLSERAAAAMAAVGVGRGDRVAVASAGGPIWPVMQTAVSRVGAILLPLNIRYRRDELSFVIGKAQPVLIVALTALRETRIVDNILDALDVLGDDAPLTRVVTFDSPTEPMAEGATSGDAGSRRLTWARFAALGHGWEGIHPPVDAGDPVLLQFTSGTTAFPKGVLLSSRATSGVAFHLAERMGLCERDTMFSTQPFYHVGGTVGTTLMPLTHRCTMAVPERYRPEAARQMIARYGATVRTGQAAMYAMELADPGFNEADYATVTRGWGAGAPALMDEITKRMGVTDIIMAYGLTEAGSISTAADWRDDSAIRTRCCGRPLPGMEVAIAQAGAVTTAADVVGEICIRGWSLMQGYFEDATATAAAIDRNGWLHTGDVGRLDASGNLHFVDRLKDMIKPGGENVSAAEVERVISALPAVARVAVVGAPDARLGQVPVAFVELHAGRHLDEQDVIDHCSAELAAFKVPRSVLFINEWPMTESGKVQKHRLASSLEAGGGRLVGQSG